MIHLFRCFKQEELKSGRPLHTIHFYEPLIPPLIGPHVSNTVLWLGDGHSPRPLTETLGQTPSWQYSGHISPDLDLTPAITTNRHGRHIPGEIARNDRTPVLRNIINYQVICQFRDRMMKLNIVQQSVNYFFRLDNDCSDSPCQTSWVVSRNEIEWRIVRLSTEKGFLTLLGRKKDTEEVY